MTPLYQSLSLRSKLLMVGFMAVLCVVVTGFFLPAHALTYNSPLGTVTCDIGAEAFAVKVIYCVKMAVFLTTTLFLAEVSDLMYPVTVSLMTLVLVILGVRIATGERDPQKMVLGFLLKFGIVLLFSYNMGDAAFGPGGLTDEVFLFIEQMQAFAIPVLYTNTTICTITGAGPGGGFIMPITYTPWEYIDCVFDYIYGFGKEATIASSLFGFIGSVFFGGSMGVMIFFMGIALVLSLALFAFRCVYIVLMSYIFVGFLLVLSPIFIPMLMFKVTERAFNKWLFNVIGGIFMPFMMVTYLAFAMPVLDTFVFGTDDKSLTSTLGKGDDVREHYRLAAPICETSVASDHDFFDDLNSNRIIGNMLNPTESGAMDWCGMLDVSKVDLGEEHIQELWEIGMSLLRILGAVFLILTVAKQIPDLTSFMVGGGMSLARSGGAPMLFESSIRGTLRQAAKQSSEGAGQSKGIFGGAGSIGNMFSRGIPGS